MTFFFLCLIKITVFYLICFLSRSYYKPNGQNRATKNEKENYDENFNPLKTLIHFQVWLIMVISHLNFNNLSIRWNCVWFLLMIKCWIVFRCLVVISWLIINWWNILIIFDLLIGFVRVVYFSWICILCWILATNAIFKIGFSSILWLIFFSFNYY